jgi:hypothetical protein
MKFTIAHAVREAVRLTADGVRAFFREIYRTPPAC